MASVSAYNILIMPLKKLLHFNFICHQKLSVVQTSLTVTCSSVCFSCVGIQENQAALIDEYHCPCCQKTHGPLIRKLTFIALNVVLGMLE